MQSTRLGAAVRPEAGATPATKQSFAERRLKSIDPATFKHERLGEAVAGQ